MKEVIYRCDLCSEVIPWGDVITVWVGAKRGDPDGGFADAIEMYQQNIKHQLCGGCLEIKLDNFGMINIEDKGFGIIKLISSLLHRKK